MAFFGKIEEFSSDKGTISNYLEIFFQASGIADEKNVPVFLALLRKCICLTLQSTVTSKAPEKQVDVLPSKNQALCCKLNLLIYCH